MPNLTNDVEITLNGETFHLRPTLKAASAISRQYGGFSGAFQALQMLNLEVAQYIVRQGITAKNLSTDDLNEAVWKSGVGRLTPVLARYIAILQNGGSDPDATEQADGNSEGNG